MTQAGSSMAGGCHLVHASPSVLQHSTICSGASCAAGLSAVLVSSSGPGTCTMLRPLSTTHKCQTQTAPLAFSEDSFWVTASGPPEGGTVPAADALNLQDGGQ